MTYDQLWTQYYRFSHITYKNQNGWVQGKFWSLFFGMFLNSQNQSNKISKYMAMQVHVLQNMMQINVLQKENF